MDCQMDEEFASNHEVEWQCWRQKKYVPHPGDALQVFK